jgi:hypothetical protein
MAEGSGLDADGESANPDRSVGNGKVEIAAMQAAFPGEITTEIEGVVAGLEADKIVFAKRRYKTLVVGQCSQNFRRRTGNVKKKANAISMPALAQRLGKGHEVVIVDQTRSSGPIVLCSSRAK